MKRSAQDRALLDAAIAQARDDASPIPSEWPDAAGLKSFKHFLVTDHALVVEQLDMALTRTSRLKT